MLRARPRRFTRVALLLAAGTGAAFAAEPTNPVGTPPADEPARAAVSAPPPPDAAASELPGEAPGGALSHWALPPPGACDPAGGLRGWPPGEDAPPLPFRPGDSFALEQLERLKDYLPEALFAQRERFFYEGMRLEIGPCFADYAPPGFYADATRRFAGQARLLPNGGLADYAAGAPFPPETIDADDPHAGDRFAWNVELRYQGGGFWGPFRTTDLVGRGGRAEPFVGEIFKAQIAFRSDRPDEGYEVAGARDKHWVVGGILFEPFDARHYAWRQYRHVEHMVEPDRSDDLHAYLPDWRRVRRISAADVEGVYMPSFSVGVVKAQALAVASGGIGEGGGAGMGMGAGAPGGANSAIAAKRSGFEGLELRPLLYDFRILGVQDLLAPINAANPVYPEQPEREFGPWGLSFASDRWDLRRALVLEGRMKGAVGGDQVARLLLTVDLQTLYPLYYVSYDSRDEPIDVGMYLGRFSEGREDYRPWPDDASREIRVIDPVGATFANLRDDGGWRRESWTVQSTPPPDRELKRDLSVTNLTKRR